MILACLCSHSVQFSSVVSISDFCFHALASGCVKEDPGHRQSQDHLVVTIVSTVNKLCPSVDVLMVQSMATRKRNGDSYITPVFTSNCSVVFLSCRILQVIPLCVAFIIDMNFSSIPLASTWSQGLSYKRLF